MITETEQPIAQSESQIRLRGLIVDDDEELSLQIAAYLGQNGFVVQTARNARAMDEALATSAFDVVILDLVLQGEGGLSICQRLAPGGPAVVILSASGADIDRIIGLELGADDYLAKPCNPRELLARVRAVLRRRGTLPATRPRSGTSGGGEYELDVARRLLVGPGGFAVLLTKSELALLTVFLDRPEEVLSRDVLFDYAKANGTDTSGRSIDVQVSRLRRKLGGTDAQDIIRTVRGAGYKLAKAVDRV